MNELASLMAVLAFSQTTLRTLLPLLEKSLKLISKLFFSHSSNCYFDIDEMDGVNNSNQLYNDVKVYLGPKLSVSDGDSGSRLTLTRTLNSSAITFGLSDDNEIPDTYNNISLFWQHRVHSDKSDRSNKSGRSVEKRSFTLRFPKKDKALVIDSYLDHIVRTAADISRRNKERRLFTNSSGYRSDRGWQSVSFKHPSTFDTLAMDSSKKEEIMNDLKDFASNGQSFYQKTGRAWKRGYLLYGPPGTGKSSLIAAMANFLGYDVYDLELTSVSDNSELRNMLIKTNSKSIIVIEDIDCSINLTNRENEVLPEALEEKPRTRDKKVTLSGMLNFIDGLWSCCGSERIFVFTTNYVEKLDPGLLRSGRMDMHIFMNYCSFQALKILLKNYLDSNEDDISKSVWDELEGLTDKARMTPADVSEHLIKHKRNKAKAVQELIGAMKLKAEGNASGDQANGTKSDSKEQDQRALVLKEEGVGTDSSMAVNLSMPGRRRNITYK